MRFECYTDWSDLPADADQLFDEASRSSLFLCREWFETLYQVEFSGGSAGDDSLMLACVVDGSQLLALLPLMRNADSLHAFSHRYTAFYNILSRQQDRQNILDVFIEGLRRLPVRSLQLVPVDEHDDDIQIFRQAMESSGFTSLTYFKFYNWIHRTAGHSYQEYMAQRPAQLRNTVARKRRKLDREHDSEIRMYRADDVRDVLADYHAAYSASWKAYEQYGDLLDALAVNLAVPDWTRLAVLYIDDQPAAAQLWFVVHGKASIFRLAYDERWKQYSTGSILTAWLMQYVIDTDKVDEIDFLVGNEKYKQDWMSERRQRCSMTFIGPQATETKSKKALTRLVDWLGMK